MYGLIRNAGHNVLRPVFIFLFACTAILCAVPCYGSGKQENAVQENQSRDYLVLIGVSGRLSNRDEAIQLALNDAARKLSFFHSVSGTSRKWQSIGMGVFDVNFDSEYLLQYDNDIDKYLEELEYNPLTDIFENNNAVFVAARVKTNVSMPVFRGHSFTGNRPGWIDSPPVEIDGFIAGVGHSTRYSSHHDTVIHSYEAAVIAIIENIEININSELHNFLTTQNLSGVTTMDETNAFGTLNNFYVIESWTDPVNLSVWTLAVAGRGQ